LLDGHNPACKVGADIIHRARPDDEERSSEDLCPVDSAAEYLIGIK